MKKIFSFIFISAIALNSFALERQAFLNRKGGQEQWVIIGARGGFSNTWLLNSNQLNDAGVKYKASWGGYGGIMLGFHFNNSGSINVEALYSTLSQNLASKIDSVNWKSKVNLAYLEFPIILRFETESFKYFEVGVKIGTLSSAKGSFNYTYSDSSTSITMENNYEKKDFGKSNISAMLGWGSAFLGSGGGLLNFGIRLSYGLSDLISEDGGKGDDYYAWGEKAPVKPKPYKPTNSATISAMLSYDFDLGWVTQSSCKRKYKFTIFKH